MEKSNLALRSIMNKRWKEIELHMEALKQCEEEMEQKLASVIELFDDLFGKSWHIEPNGFENCVEKMKFSNNC